MAFCMNCGSKLMDGAKFCANCGAKCEAPVPDRPTQTRSESFAQEPAAPAEPQSYRPVQQEQASRQSYTSPVQQSYTPPVQDSYTPPVQGSYAQPTYAVAEAPVAQESAAPAEPQSYRPVQQEQASRQSYTPPVQQSYTSPVQQSYTPPAQQPYAPAQTGGVRPAPAPEKTPKAKMPKKKKQGNKKLLFILGGIALATVVIAVALILLLGGNSGAPVASDDPHIGTWNAEKVSMLGIEMDVGDVFAQGATLELMEKGKCVFTVDGNALKGKWSAEDNEVTLSGTGLDCTATIEGGILTLSNYLNTGMDLSFVKEGGYAQIPAASGGETPQLSAGTASGLSELQKQWNGTWFGVIDITQAEGAYAAIPGDRFDAYMVVDVDAEGHGDFAVYIAGAQDAFVKADCMAYEYGLDAVSGTVAGGEELFAYNWMFRANPNFADQFVISDEMAHGADTLDFSLFMKKWGGSWQAEVDSGFYIAPPSADAYHAAIANGELPPVGYAPFGYGGDSGSGSAPAVGNTSGGAYAWEGPTEKYNYFDELFVSYPSDTFFLDESAILDTIAAKDGSVEISMVVRTHSSDYDSLMEYLDGYSTYEGYTTQDLTIAGYGARLVTHKGDWGDHQAEIFVYFGEPVNGNYGISFVVSAAAAEDCTSDAVMAIVNSLELAQ